MQDDDTATGDCHAAAAGLLQCLQMLAVEADRRGLSRTHGALRKAVRACWAEEAQDRAAPRPRHRRSLALH
ncbi:MAG: hypothetical protein ABSC95_23620 [Acetobacteraceae bacterium]|jgi:hypothetical protein